jgi:predicted Zn finger-like uncharacterized protein
MPILVVCPACHRQLRVPEELLGKPVRCAACSKTFTAQAPATNAPPAPQGADAPPPAASPTPASPFSVTSTPSERQPEPPPAPAPPKVACPHCGERIPTEARQCPHCEEPLTGEEEEEERPWEQRGRPMVRRDCEPHRGSLVLTFGIISVVLAPLSACCGVFGVAFCGLSLGLGIPAWVMGRRDLNKMSRGEMDPEGRGLTQGGMICGIIGTCLAILMMVILAIIIVFYIGVIVWTVNNPPPTFPAPTPAPSTRKMFFGGGPLRLQDHLPCLSPGKTGSGARSNVGRSFHHP